MLKAKKSEALKSGNVLNQDFVDISVIIPAYNRAELIGETLRSLLNQTISAKEIIVVDDGSTDGTAEQTLKAYEDWKLETGNWKNDAGEQVSENSKSNIPALKILHQQNSGPGAARNRGFAESTGEFVHFFDSDDIAAPNKHEAQLRVLLETGADIAYGPWVKGRFLPKCESGDEFSSFKVQFSGFSPEGPVLQARGLPEGDLVVALITNWSVVPHACLFRRSIVEKIGGFPEDLLGSEDQLMFLRCLLVGAKVVHSPGTIELYRVGDPSKITATGAAQKRFAIEWAKFLLKAKEELASGEWRVARSGRRVSTEAQGSGEALATDPTDEPRYSAGLPPSSQAGAAFSHPSTSEVARDSENTSLTRCAISPASSPDTRNFLLDTTTPVAWFGFRMRAYAAWLDLRAFFPGEYLDLESGLERIWKRSMFSVFRLQISAFLLRKLGGLKQRVVGHRWPASFRCEVRNKSSLEAMMK